MAVIIAIRNLRRDSINNPLSETVSLTDANSVQVRLLIH